jgi:flagellar hook-associated protein 2
MASITSAGIGSGLDVASLVAQLVAAERAPAQRRIASVGSRITVELSALGSFKAALAGVQTRVKALTSGALDALKASSSKPEVLTATATSSAAAGSYEIEVVSLAKAHKLVSGVYAGGEDSVLGAGTVAIDVGGESFTVTLDADDTFADLKGFINSATDNTGVSAALITESGGTRLLLTAKQTGTEQQIAVTTTLATFTEKQAATDAHLRIEGYDHYAQSNTVTGAIDGVTINLLDDDVGQIHTLAVAPDKDAVSKAVSAFVTAYNSAVTTAASLTRYDAENGRASALTGNSTVRSAMQALRSVLGATVDTGSFDYLSEIGITTKVDGTLSLDSAKLAEALASDRTSVAALFASEGGYATRLDEVLERFVGDDGYVEARTESMQSRLEALDQQQAALDLRMERVEARYRAQFTALDALLSQMSTTSNYLTQQLDALANLNRSSR